jgi:signal transduction histidine kinase
VSSPGPKKLLALDGGGIRGVITLEVLLRLESMLAEQFGAGDDFVLGDYFDYIGGTSTGAVIATGLAKGLRVEQLLDLYVTRCEEMFDHASLRRRYQYRYGSLRLRELLQGIFGKDTTLGSEDLKTLLLIVVRNATVAIWRKLIDASTKREDRQHEIALEVEKRFGQDKINALKTLIAAAQHVKWRAQLTGAPNTDEAHRRAVTIRALHEFRTKLGVEDGIAELLAYAADPVRQAVEALLADVNQQRGQHQLLLMQLQNIERQLSTLPNPQPGPEIGDAIPMTPMNVDVFQQWQLLHRADSKTLDMIGTRSDLDVDGVIALCDRVINAARLDLRGRYGND